MSDLEERLRVVERVPVPDVWDRAVARSADVARGAAVPDPTPPGGQRLAAAAVALVLAAGGIALVVRAFGDREDRIAEPSPVLVTDLDGTSWVLTTLNDEPVVHGTEASWMTLTFRKGTYALQTGCNAMAGAYEIDKGSLLPEAGEGVTCGSGLTASEQSLFDALSVPSTATVHGATLTLDAIDHQLSFVQNPCSLLTSDEVTAAIGGSVRSSGLVPPSGMKVPGTGPVCSYDVPTTPYSSVNVGIETSTLQRFEAEAAADVANFMDISGVAERAYISGMGSIVILDGEREIEIGLQHGAGDAAVPILEALGRAATDGDVVPEASGRPQPGTVPATLVLDCAAGGETRVSPIVEASPDGVHVRVTGASPEVHFKGGVGAIIDGTKAELVFSLAPGQNAVRCVVGDPDRAGGYLPFEVVDPAGLWVDPTLDCPGRFKEVEYLNNEPLRVKGDPSDEMTSFTEEEFAGRFPEEGSVIPVGYPQAERPYFGFVSREGSVFGIVGFHEGLPGDWLPEFYRACEF